MNKELIRKIFKINDSIINDKKTNKEDRKTYIAINKELIKLYGKDEKACKDYEKIIEEVI